MTTGATGGREHWAVTVERNGEAILTIDKLMIGGKLLTPADEDCIERCARHLLAFIGRDRRESQP